jgi:hypothetical protein
VVQDNDGENINKNSGGKRKATDFHSPEPMKKVK